MSPVTTIRVSWPDGLLRKAKVAAAARNQSLGHLTIEAIARHVEAIRMPRHEDALNKHRDYQTKHKVKKLLAAHGTQFIPPAGQKSAAPPAPLPTDLPEAFAAVACPICGHPWRAHQSRRKSQHLFCIHGTCSCRQPVSACPPEARL